MTKTVDLTQELTDEQKALKDITYGLMDGISKELGAHGFVACFLVRGEKSTELRTVARRISPNELFEVIVSLMETYTKARQAEAKENESGADDSGRVG